MRTCVFFNYISFSVVLPFLPILFPFCFTLCSSSVLQFCSCFCLVFFAVYSEPLTCVAVEGRVALEVLVVDTDANPGGTAVYTDQLVQRRRFLLGRRRARKVADGLVLVVIVSRDRL